jgi:protease-4
MSITRTLRLGLVLLTALLSGCVFITGNLNPFASTPQPLEEYVVSGEGRAKILLLDISRMISTQEDQGILGISRREGLTARIDEELRRAAEDDKVRAVVLRINSPGGTVTASDVIYHQIMAFKAVHHVPVTAQFLDMGTSGAYYVALAADEIVASPTTVTGSVGVVMYGVNFAGLMDKLGVKNQTIKSGAHKDIGSPLRPMTPEDQAILQDVLDGMQQRFLGLVRQRRTGLSAEAVHTISDGRILTADQALQLGLVDRIGYLQDTLQGVAQQVGAGQARVIMYRRPQEFAENIYSAAPLPASQLNLISLDLGAGAHASPEFMYLWRPTLE